MILLILFHSLIDFQLFLQVNIYKQFLSDVVKENIVEFVLVSIFLYLFYIDNNLDDKEI